MNLIISFVCAALFAAVAVAASSAGTTSLAGYLIFDMYEDTQCGVDGGPYGGIQYSYGYALNTCMKWNAYQSSTSKTGTVYYVMYTADLSCQTITMTVYSASTCSSSDVVKTGVTAGGVTCTNNVCSYTWSGGLCSSVSNMQGYSQYAYCSYSAGLPQMNYASVVMSGYSINLDDGCTGTPNKFTSYPADACIQTATSMSQMYSCTKNADDDGAQITASFTSYQTGNCRGSGNSVGLSGVCSLTSYTDDDYNGSPQTASMNGQYSCQGYSGDDDALSGGAIAGITIGVIIFVVLVAGGFYMCMGKKPVEEDSEPLKGDS